MPTDNIQLFFDLSTFHPQKKTGLGVYMQQLLNHIPRPEIHLTPLLKISHWLRAKDVEQSIQQKVQIFKPWRLHVPANSIYHGPDFRLSLRAPKLRRVVTIHDMLVFEGKYSDPVFDEVGRKDIRKIFTRLRPDAVIANSEFTKTQILKHFPEYQERVHVTLLGCDRWQPASTLESQLTVPDKYFFFLGSLEIRKNLLGIIQAYELFRKQGGREKLVLCGFWGYGETPIKRAISNSVFTQDILVLQRISDADCAKLFQQATAFVFPSLYEGFGIPVLEAMKWGCPVVTSNEGALSEICGGAAFQADPHSPEALAEKLIEVVRSKDLRDASVQQGFTRAQEFTWQRCADQTVEVYKKVLGLP